MNTLSQFPEWLDRVKHLTGDRFDFWEVVYPFRDAFDRGLTPDRAVKEARAVSNGD